MDNVGIVVEDLDAAVAFFTGLRMELEGGAQIEGPWVDRTARSAGLEPGRDHVIRALRARGVARHSAQELVPG